MKICYLIILLAGTYTNSISQMTGYNRNDSANIMNVDYMYYSLDGTDKSSHSGKLPFKSIIFFDVRFDTSFITINWQVNKNPMVGLKIQNRKYSLRESLAGGLTTYFNTYYKDNLSDNSGQVFCYVKKLSLNLMDTVIEDASRRESINRVRFEAECYYVPGDTLYPAARIDTSYGERITNIKKSFPDIIKDIVYPLAQRLAGIDPVRIQKRNHYTLQQIHDRYESRFNLPILTTQQYKRGVYRNFSEFINNAPSITHFTVKPRGFQAFLYDAEGQVIPRAFGFCDGKRYWKFGGVYCSPLVRVGHSFEYFYTLYIMTTYYTVAKKYLLALNMDRVY